MSAFLGFMKRVPALFVNIWYLAKLLLDPEIKLKSVVDLSVFHAQSRVIHSEVAQILTQVLDFSAQLRRTEQQASVATSHLRQPEKAAESVEVQESIAAREVRLVDDTGKVAAIFEAAKEGPRIRFFPKEGGPSLLLGIVDDNPSVLFHQPDGRSVYVALPASSDVTALQLRSAGGEKSATFMLLKSGAFLLDVRDEKNETRLGCIAIVPTEWGTCVYATNDTDETHWLVKPKGLT